MTPHAGQPIGNVRLQEKIGEGGMGSVWSAHHVTLGRDVAVKFLSTECDADDPAALRFKLEARTIARISSPHVPQVFDHGTCPDGTPYIVMELIEGADLRSRLADRGPLSLTQTVRLVEQVSLALTAAHELGIIHRDIKPENLILTGGDSTFQVKLIDFGIAKATGATALSLRTSAGPSLTAAGTTMGTASYMSPEQLMSGGEVDARCDLWSLAVVAYWSLTGRLPFVGDTFTAVGVAIVLTDFTPVTKTRPDLPPTLDAWFRTALASDPRDRFDSARAMSDALAAAAAGHPGADDHGSPPPPSPRPAARATTLSDGPSAPSALVLARGEPRTPGATSSRRGRALDAAAVGVVAMFIAGSAVVWSGTFPAGSSRAASTAGWTEAAHRLPAPGPTAPLAAPSPIERPLAPMLDPEMDVGPDLDGARQEVRVTPVSVVRQDPTPSASSLGDVHFTTPTFEAIPEVSRRVMPSGAVTPAASAAPLASDSRARVTHPAGDGGSGPSSVP